MPASRKSATALVHGILVDIGGSRSLAIISLSAHHDFFIVRHFHDFGSAFREAAFARAGPYGDCLADILDQIRAPCSGPLHQADRRPFETPTSHFATRTRRDWSFRRPLRFNVKINVR